MTETPIWCLMPWLNSVDLTLQAVEDCLAQSVPTRVLLIDQGASKADREQVDAWIDQRSLRPPAPFNTDPTYTLVTEDHRVLCWHFNPPLPSLSAVWNRALAFVWELGGTEALVVNNDLRLSRHTVEVLQNCLHGTKSLFVSAVGVKEGQFDPEFDYQTVSSGDRGGPDFSCFLLSRAGHEKYPFDESFQPAYCEDLDQHRRYMLGGDGARIFSVNLPFLHYASGTIKSYTPEERATFNKRYAGVVARYTSLWGGGPNQETFTCKGNPESARAGVTTPDLQRMVQSGVSGEEMLKLRNPPVSYEALEKAYMQAVVGQFLPDGSINPDWVAPDPRD